MKQTEETKLFIKQCEQVLRLGVFKTQRELAIKIKYNPGSLSEVVNGVKNIPPVIYANFCKLYSQIESKNQNYMISQDQVNELFKLLMLQAETINNLSKKK